MPEGFRQHARYAGIGACLKQVVGPGPEPGSERLYASYGYFRGTLDIVAVNPLTGEAEVFSGPLPSEMGAYAMALGPDGQIYLGTCIRAHVLRLDWKQRRLVDLGRPSETEQYIWGFALGTDKKLYGCTSPNGKLVRYDPATDKAEDLGRMDPKEELARSIASDDKGFIYVGIGTAARHLVAYEISTGRRQNILPAELSGIGTCGVSVGADGKAYGAAGGQSLRLEGWEAVPIPAEQCPGGPPLILADGRAVSYDGRSISVSDPMTSQAIQKRVIYQGKGMCPYRIGLGPDGRLYGSTLVPLHFFRADPDSEHWEKIGELGGGEFYSFIAHKDVLVGAAYGALATIMIYRPDKPFAPDKAPGGNPWLIHYKGENSGWRPKAMIDGPEDKVYIGAMPGYGELGGPMCVLDPATGKVDVYRHLVQDQSVIALAELPDGLIVGGTTVIGGSGSHETQKDGKIFLWDPKRREKLFEAVAVPGQKGVEALAVGPDGLVYGFASCGGQNGSTFFVFDPAAQKVIQVVDREVHGLEGCLTYDTVALHCAMGPGPGGELYGLDRSGIFAVDRKERRPRLLARYPNGIDGGFAIRGRQIFFISGGNIVSYTLS